MHVVSVPYTHLLAEEGFEPLIRFHVYTRSRHAPQTTRPPFPSSHPLGISGAQAQSISLKSSQAVRPSHRKAARPLDCAARPIASAAWGSSLSYGASLLKRPIIFECSLLISFDFS